MISLLPVFHALAAVSSMELILAVGSVVVGGFLLAKGIGCFLKIVSTTAKPSKT